MSYVETVSFVRQFFGWGEKMFSKALDGQLSGWETGLSPPRFAKGERPERPERHFSVVENHVELRIWVLNQK